MSAIILLKKVEKIDYLKFTKHNYNNYNKYCFPKMATRNTVCMHCYTNQPNMFADYCDDCEASLLDIIKKRKEERREQERLNKIEGDRLRKEFEERNEKFKKEWTEKFNNLSIDEQKNVIQYNINHDNAMKRIHENQKKQLHEWYIKQKRQCNTN